MTSTLAQHDKLLPEIIISPKPEKCATRPGQERCSEQYMIDVLACISPDNKRKDGWLQVIAAFTDANVILSDGKLLPHDEKGKMLRMWSAEGATYEDESFDEAVEWYAERMNDEDRTRVRLGTVDMLARSADYTGPGPTKSAQIVEIQTPFRAMEQSGSQEIIPPPISTGPRQELRSKHSKTPSRP